MKVETVSAKEWLEHRWADESYGAVHCPRRGDAIEGWLEWCRTQTVVRREVRLLDQLLQSYRAVADDQRLIVCSPDAP